MRKATAGKTTPRVDGETVRCLSAHVQLAHHLGYEPRSHDRDDMRRFADRFSLQLPPPYDA